MRRRKQKDNNAQYGSGDTNFSNFTWENYGVNQLNNVQNGAVPWESAQLNVDSFAVDPALPQGVKAFNGAALAFSLAGGFIGAVLAILVNSLVIRGLLDPVAKLRLCQILMIGSSMMLVGCGALTGLYLSRVFYPARLRLNPAAGVVLALAAAALLAVGCLMQFLYSLGGASIAVPADDYLFVIDDSGSMSGTDPMNARVTSMKHLMNRLTPENHIGMIFFNEGIVYESQMAPMSAAKMNEYTQAVGQLRNSGSTDLHNAIEYALNMSGVDDPDRLTEIVLLTDGESGWVRKKHLAKLCTRYNVRISAIALSDAINAGVLQSLTRMTGGALYPVAELDDLIDVYSKVGVVSNVRDLLGLRTGTDHGSIWLGLMRMLSWAMMGFIVGAAMMLAVWSEPRHVPLVTTAAGLGFGIVLELMNLIWLDGAIFSTNWKMLLVPLVCITVLFYRKEPDYSIGNMQIDWIQRSGSNGDANRLNSNQDNDNTIYKL